MINTMAEKSGRKQNAISLKVKMELLKAVDEEHISKTDICRRFGIGNSTLSAVIKNRDQLTAMFEHRMFKPDRKRMRMPKYEDLEAALLVWFKQARSQNAPISGPLLMEKAGVFAMQMGIQFTPNPGWLERFKKRNGIVFSKNVCGEANHVSPSMISDWLHSTLPTELEEYSPSDVFNAEETVLFYRCLPSKTLSLKGLQCSGSKTSRERITVMVACNSDGSEKLPLFVIGKSIKPRCFKNVKKLPVEYTANKKAWMVATMFTDWLLNLDKRFLREKRKVAMIVDNCPVYPEVRLKAVKLVFLPPNTTSILRPSNQSVVQNLKFYYRKQLVTKYLIAIEAKEDFSINLLDALHMLRTAWNLVTPKTIENCFRHAGFSKTADLIPTHESADNQEAEPIFSEMFGCVSAILECPLSLDEFVAVDDNVCKAPILTDNDIVDAVQTTKSDPTAEDSDDNVDNEIDLSVPVPTASEMRKFIKSMRRYLDVHSSGEMNQTMDDIEQFVDNIMIKNTMQKKI